MARKPIPKNIRFEVFKRDKFTCQYCGASAPDVILEVDHLKPVSKGGTNDLLNLVTSCRDCNRGKTNKELSDDSAVKVQKKQLDDMQERREQMKMMLEWKNSLENEMELEIDAIENLFIKYAKYGFNSSGRIGIRRLIKRFGFNEVMEATEIAIDRYYNPAFEETWDDAYRKIGGICYNRKKASDQNA